MRFLFVTPQFKKDFTVLPPQVQVIADKVTELLMQNPLNNSLNIRKLKEFRQPLWRVRIGTYRLVYSFSKESLILHRIRHRRDVYRNL